MFLIAASCTPVADAGRGSGSDAITDRFEHAMLVRMHMHENFGMVHALDRLLVRNRLEEARELARGIALSPDEPGFSAWAAETTRVRDRVAAIVAAKTVDEGLHALTKLGAACASCHAATNTLPDIAAPGTPPPDLDTVPGRMARHRWATDRLWEATVGLSDESWKAGLDVLATAPLPATELGADRETLALELQKTARRARTVRPADRADAYAELLVTCAGCHAK